MTGCMEKSLTEEEQKHVTKIAFQIINETTQLELAMTAYKSEKNKSSFNENFNTLINNLEGNSNIIKKSFLIDNENTILEDSDNGKILSMKISESSKIIEKEICLFIENASQGNSKGKELQKGIFEYDLKNSNKDNFILEKNYGCFQHDNDFIFLYKLEK